MECKQPSKEDIANKKQNTTGKCESGETEKKQIEEEQKTEPINRVKNEICLSVEADEIVAYVTQQNGVQIIHDVCIKNTTEEDIDDLVLKIDSDTQLIELFEIGIQKIRAKEEIHLKKLKIKINGDYLVSLTERVTCSLRFCVYDQEKLLYIEKKDIIALAFDQWLGFKYTPELLAAFSIPNHPVIASLLQLSAKYLEKWTADPSLAGYQFNNPNRVKQMAAAAYAAIQQKNITYANPPSSFEVFGQRVRLADAVIEQHLGTCLDMTLLYVACLEAMGLNPIMVLMNGHIFAGVWLIDDSFSDTIMLDPSHIEKRMANGIREIIVVECTAMCAGKTQDFDQAVKIAEENIADYNHFKFAIDITRARSMGIRPLPIRIMTDAGFVVKQEDRKEKDVTCEPSEIGMTFDLNHLEDKARVTKKEQWERKLLDLSMRNMLINLRFTKTVVPLLCSNISILEDALADGEAFQVLPRPDNMIIKGEGIPVEALTNLGPFQEFMELESRHRKLHAFYLEKELSSCLTKLYRSARASLEENGANTLYLALGLLRWKETKTDETAYYAPIILLPIDITRKSAGKGYTMRMRDEEGQINITLLEFLKQNFGIQIAGLNPLPTDDHGLDVPKIFAIMRHAVMNLEMWDVLEAGFIGNFSFSQFVMWNDIHSGSDMLEQNDIVRSLMKGAVDWNCTIPDCVDTDEAYLPITVDASQLRAINMAAADVSFVLHGPPGTGKSQTITAMIANALTKGKTVLFVAEKMAALEVVQRRLEALGIGDFCLELHSNKTTKKAVLDQLKKTLEISAQGMKTEYEEMIQDIRVMKTNLDAYVKKLHEQRAFGKSLKELIDTYETILDFGVDLRFPLSDAKTMTQSKLQSQKRLLEQLVAAGKQVGHPHKHPLSAIRQTVYTQTLRMELEESVKAYKMALEELNTSVIKWVNQLSIDKPVTEQEWKNIYRYADSIQWVQEIPSHLLNTENLDMEFNLPLAYIAEHDAYIAKKSALLENWKEIFLQMDMHTYHTKYDIANKKLFGKRKALSNLAAEIQSFASFTVTVEQIPVILADIEMYQKQEHELKMKEAQLPFDWRPIIEKYPTSQLLQTYKQDIKGQLAVIKQFSTQIKQIEQAGELIDCTENARKILNDFMSLKEKEKAVTELLVLSYEENKDNWIEDKKALCECLITNASTIKDWIVYRQLDNACRKEGLDLVCDAYESGLPHEQVISVYLRAIYKAMILSIIEMEPVLNRFTGNGFNEQIAQFKKLDEKFMNLTKEEMYYKLTHQLPNEYESVQISKELNSLRRAISSNGRGVSIRALFEQIPHVLMKLSPCMLMSPISVAQYLSAENNLYDIVIFDEASQLPTCKAVGALARGKNAVIVGDPNQMPPTSFFAGNTIDKDNLDIEDLDSILDDCLALGMPSAHLRWHYRSRHESLIAFSNHEFYENSMLTFPSVNDRERRVKMIKVDSFFDRKKGRVNEGEARAIISEIKRRYKNSELKNQTIGVVTFNMSQQNLIEDLLQEEFAKDIELDKWACTGEEPLFVKNLENVQGDERDIILFSVAFGPDEEGKLSLNFGPLNKEGGWKRLNVAVSRARREMVVFSTMTADMIDLKRTKSKGVESLKNFLEFAEKGKLKTSYSEMQVKKNQGILDRICLELEKAGYKCQKFVGHSKFKVDIAVINPYNEDEYLLGIMLDGDSYCQSCNTKDREMAQFNVLKELGWRLHRVWTMDWWDDKQKEINRILSLLEEEEKNVSGVAKEAKQLEEVSEQTVSPKESNQENVIQKIIYKEQLEETADESCASSQVQPKLEMQGARYSVEMYNSADVEVTPMSTAEYVLKNSMSKITEKLQYIIEIEAPISYDRLIKRTLRAFGIARSSAQTIEATEKALRQVTVKSNKHNGVKFFWKTDQDPNTYTIYRNDTQLADKRSLEDICQQELKNAICTTLQDKGALEKDDLIKETIRIMGYGRSGAALVEAVERGLKYGRKTGEVVQNEDKKFSLSNFK